MRDDILIINENHQKAAREILEMIVPDIHAKKGKYLITVAGESGAGKSEIASALADMLEKRGITTYIIQQDDYFKYPPKTNARMRLEDIRRVGPGEVRLDLLNKTVSSLLESNDPLDKPLVIFSDDRITTETVDLADYRVIIIEGTYTTLIEKIDCRVFIDRDLDDTRPDRLKRNREVQDDYLEQILGIEHEIISRHKTSADIIISKAFSATRQK